MELDSDQQTIGRVIRILNDHEVIINLGKKDGIYYGQKLGVFNIVGEVTDPFNNHNWLGSYETLIEILTPRVIHQNYSILYKRLFVLPTTSSINTSITRKEAMRLDVDPNSIAPFNNDERTTIKLGDIVRKLKIF